MKQLFLLFLSSSAILMAQSILPPQFSHDSGFYTEEFDLVLSHENPEVKIIYTLDGSEPSIDNLNGRNFNYKKRYPELPGQLPFELYTDKLQSFPYTTPININDRKADENRIAKISTNYSHQPYLPDNAILKTHLLRSKLI